MESYFCGVARTRIDIQPSLLTWAIERAGVAVEDFLRTYPKAESWINLENKPTLRQLEEFARKVHVPFGYLLLNSPPEETQPLPLFRTTGGMDNSIPLAVRDMIRLTRTRQEWLSDYLEQLGTEPLDFIGSVDAQISAAELVERMRTQLDLLPDWSRQLTSKTTTLDHLVATAERVGIVVTFNGVVGNNNRRKIPVESCRGFVLLDRYAPFVFVNNADAKAAQLFTLAHELAHLWLGVEGVFDLQRILPSNDPVERLCNEAAAELLLPETLFREEWETTPDVYHLAKRFKVSPIVAARRALDLGEWNRNQYFTFYRNQRNEWNERRAGQPSGGNFYATTNKRLSKRFLEHVHAATQTGNLPYDRAYRLTGLKRSTFTTTMEQNFGGV